MKKLFMLFILVILLCTVGCSKKPINYMKVDWTLDSSIKPNFKFERSKKNDSNGIFYVDSQIEFSKFVEYIKTLKENKFEIDWKYSDVDSIEKLEEEYSKTDSKDNIFNDGYVNFKMCKDKLCLFMQWVNKEKYNSLNKDKPCSYSFYLETETTN